MTSIRPFVILYTSREGSSALIDYLGRHPAICVPAVEHLDKHNVSSRIDNPGERVGEILDDVLTAGVVPGQPQVYRGEPVIGFKWRPFGSAAAQEALRRHRCLVYFLFRRDALARALSIELSPVHLQFAIANMPAANRAEALRQARAQRFTADPGAVASTIVSYRQQKALLWDTYCAGLDAMPLEYESFASRPLDALNRILTTIGVEPYVELPPCTYHKTTSDDIRRQCENVREVRSFPAVRDALESYALFLQRIGAEQPRRWWHLRRGTR